jgi:hypothetical protein
MAVLCITPASSPILDATLCSVAAGVRLWEDCQRKVCGKTEETVDFSSVNLYALETVLEEEEEVIDCYLYANFTSFVRV